MKRISHATGAGLRLALLTGALALVAGRAKASPLFELIGDPQGMGGLQARTVPGSHFAAYFNPALLTDTPAGLQLGLAILAQRISFSPDARPSTQFDVPLIEGRGRISDAQHGDFTPLARVPIATRDLELGREALANGTGAFRARPRQADGSGNQDYYYMGFGMGVKLFEDRLTVGVSGLIPLQKFTTIHAYFSDEREQYFSNSLHPTLYTDRLTSISIAFGAGVRIIDGLSLGVGATLSLQANAVAPTFVSDPTKLDEILIDMDTSVDVALTPHFGVSYTVLDDRLRFSGSLHPPQQMEFATNFGFTLPTGVEQGSGVPFVLNYLPWRGSVGGSFDLLSAKDQALSLVGTLAYAAWSSYVDRHGQTPSGPYAWSDTIAPTLGTRFQTGKFSALLDVTYLPTPVPLQTGRTNYADNDRISGAIGGEYGFELFGADVQVGLQFQTHYLVERHQWKLEPPAQVDTTNIAPELVWDELPSDAQISNVPVEGSQGLQTNNPGFPGFGSQGVLFAGSLYFKILI